MEHEPLTEARVEELYRAWAAESSPWSAWVKPVLFASMAGRTLEGIAATPTETAEWAPPPDHRLAVIVDVPGAPAVQVGLALARLGYRPVPLFNGTAGAGMIVDVSGIMAGLVAGGPVLTGLTLPSTAPPAFLVDADRQAFGRVVDPGRYDNRWCVLPQDFPSARRLRELGAAGVLLYSAVVRSDLAHVLRRYEEDGLPLLHAQPGTVVDPPPLSVPRPSSFRGLWYRIGVVLGLRRNAAGGFGARVPEPGSGGFG